MTKLDLKKEMKTLYHPPVGEPVFVDVPAMNFLMIDGKGDPNTAQSFKDAIGVLYAVSFTLKFMIKFSDGGKDYVVPPLEGLWWADDMGVFLRQEKEKWEWTLMIAQPGQVTKALVRKAVARVREKSDPPALSKVRFDRFHEGRCAQIMHLGPYAAEGPTIEKLHAFISAGGYARRGRHHEIYLSDPRRSAPGRLKTVLRQPIQ